MWEKCLAGDPAAWRKMATYNKRDVTLLQELHDKLLPWIPVPNANLYNDGTRVCPKCEKETIQHRGFYRLATGTYRRLWCNKDIGGCGAWSRETRRISGAEVVEVA